MFIPKGRDYILVSRALPIIEFFPPPPEDLDIFKLEMVNLFGQVSLCCLLTHCLPTSDDFSIYKYMDEIAGRVQVDSDEDDLSADKISRNEEDGDENGELNA